VSPPFKPIEKLVLDAAQKSGCTDEAAAIQALQIAGQNGGRFIDALLDAGVLPDETAFFRTLGEALELPFLVVPEPDPKNPPHTRLPARLALRYRVLAGAADGDALQLLVYDPFDLEARQMAGQFLDQTVSWGLSTRTAIMEKLRGSYGVGAGHFDELIEDKNSDAEPDALRQEGDRSSRRMKRRRS
jgi:hypothetical protein